MHVLRRSVIGMGCLIGLTGCPLHFKTNVEDPQVRDVALASAGGAPRTMGLARRSTRAIIPKRSVMVP